ncbi:hypothetical protein PGT21_026867 [Puccinia graminis f. sp. tritici]|uniref:WW domain-containing protein n=1 Tax=Puccinia graminis f. sp. tritici TaxID=56615 RepID=A0A5B0LWB9_PUCGR|nr:hypothetical protein PGTUg99_010818 [Puccinia graminis f. sp. tritici]KAA1104562.1 hypothetical protein PGT21_026867 [Puccinia graminis f. sp. tritici]
MESVQPPSKRTRAHSASSASDQESSHPTKAVKTESHHHPDQSLEQAGDSGPPDTSKTQLVVPLDDEHSQSQPEPSTGKSEKIQSKDSRDTSEAGLKAPPQEDPHPTASTSRESNAPATETGSQSELQTDDPKPVVYSNGDWEAVYDTQTNAYYFVNSKTGETTWRNPLVPATEPAAVGVAAQPAPDLGGIDPELAHLDPHFARLIHGHASQTEPRFAARFNAKTGRFEGDPTRDPSRVSEFARARTQAEAFFDVTGWEKTLEKHNGRVPGTSKETRAAALEQGKKLSKAQLNQFKQQKMEKKARNQRAWLT